MWKVVAAVAVAVAVARTCTTRKRSASSASREGHERSGGGPRPRMRGRRARRTGRTGGTGGTRRGQRGRWGTSTRPARIARVARAERPARRAPNNLIHQLQSTHAANCPSPSRMRHPPIMSDAKPPTTTIDTRARSTQQYGLHSSWDQECAGKAKTVAKTDTPKNATKTTRGRLI